MLHLFTANRLWLILALWGGLLTTFIYGDSLTLPFFFDDFVHLPYIDATSFSDIWRTAGSLAYYRPLTFTLWKLLYLVLNHHNPVIHHTINLGLHLLNGLLSAQLAGTLWPDTYTWLRRWLTATLYWLFPFGYQAIPWAGALSQILVTTLILLALSCYWRAKKDIFPLRWYFLSLFFTILAPFTHENGILVSPFLFLLLWTTPSRKLVDSLWHSFIWLLPALFWFPIWWLVPKAISGQVQVNGSEPIWQNLIYFAQGLSYPTTWLGGWLRDRHNWPDMVAALALISIGLSLAILFLGTGKATRRSLLPGLWWLIAISPATFFLPFNYVINGPRLLSVASIGITWLWADVAIKLATGQSCKSVWRYGVIGAVGIILLGQNIFFIEQGMKLHQLLGTVFHQVTQQASQTPITLINFPSWLAPRQATYALGHEGVLFWPDYASPNALITVQTGEAVTVYLVRHEATRATPPYFYGVSGSPLDWSTLLPTAGRIFATRYTPQTITIHPVGANAIPPTTAPFAQFILPNNHHLLDLHQATATLQGNGLLLDLLWQLHTPSNEEITVFVHLINTQSGQLVAQLDGDPLAGTYPFSHWPPNQTLYDSRWLPLESSQVIVLIGLYNRQTGERVTVISNQLTMPKRPS